MVILTQKKFPKSINSKIPEYARDYKKEYLLIRGINKKLENFFDIHLSRYDDYILPYHKRIEYFMKRFMKAQERGYFKDISSFTFKNCDVANIYLKKDIFKILNYFDNFENYKDFYDVFCKFYNKINFYEFINSDSDIEFIISDSDIE